MSVIVPLDVPSASTLAPLSVRLGYLLLFLFIVLCCCTTSMAAEAVCNPHAGAKVAIVKNRATGKVVPFIKFFLFIYVYVHDISIVDGLYIPSCLFLECEHHTEIAGA